MWVKRQSNSAAKGKGVNMKKFFKTFSMQKKLIMLFFVCTVIPTIAFFTFAVTPLYKNELADYNTSVEKKLNGAANVIDKYIDENILKGDTIIRSSLVVEGLQKNYENDFTAAMLYHSELKQFIAGFENYGETKYCIYPMEESLPQGQYIENVEKLKNRTNIWNELNDGSNSVFVWDYSNITGENTDGYISLFQKINYYEKVLGFLEIRMYVSKIVYPLQNISIADGESIFCTSPDGVRFYSNDVSPEEKSSIRHDVSLICGSMVSSVISRKYVLKNYYRYIIYYFFGFFLLVTALFFLYKRMILSITKDLNSFIGVIQENAELKPDDMTIDDSVDPDVMLIKQKFYDLLVKTRKMYLDIAEMTRIKKVMELELLQSGINPHLLYNSLSVIRWQMMRLNQSELVEMIDNMSEYYRGVLSGGDYIITIGEELELVDKYIKINELSYRNKYTVVKNIEADVLEMPIIKLILQPIVENSILHGLVDNDNGIIKISATKNNENIILTVEDNGYGMSDEDIVKALDIKKVQQRKGGYGISNTIKRIKAYYGDEYGIEIISEIGKGTKVIIKIKNVEREELKSRFESGD